MKKIILAFALCCSQLSISFAALPPIYQNKKDLNVMMEFIESHKKVLSTLQAINFKAKVIHFGDDCKVVFGRKTRSKPAGWVGPAASLEFKRATCDID